MQALQPGRHLKVRQRILLVDDCDTSLRVEELILRRGGYEILKARSGLEALRRAHGERPDLILLDVRLPDLSGLEVLRLVRAQQETRHIPVLVVSVRGDEATRQAALCRGCCEYVTKPVDATELRARVDRLLARAATPTEPGGAGLRVACFPAS